MRRSTKALVPLLLMLLVASCSQNDNVQLREWAGFRMTLPYRILIAGESDQQAVAVAIEAVFSEIDSVFNDWNPESEVSRLSGPQSSLSPALAALLQRTDHLVALTGGRFDPTVGRLSHLWKEALRRGELPDVAERERLENALGWQHVRLDGHVLHFDQESASLDLGAIAKGLAVDMLHEHLLELGYHDIYVEWGGEIRVHGEHPSGRPWRVGIHGVESNEVLEVVELEQGAVATSGDYIQAWQLPGEERWVTHIIDPESKQPLELRAGSISSVTVIAEDAVKADALATAAILLPNLEAAEQWAAQVKQTQPDLRFWFQVRNLAPKEEGA